MTNGTDANNDNLISKDEFIRMLHDKKATGILHEVGVDVVGLVDFADTIFEPTPGREQLGERELTVAEFMKVILELRGDQTAKIRDIMEMRKYMKACFMHLEQRLADTELAGRLSQSLHNGSTALRDAEKPAAAAAPVTELWSIWGSSKIQGSPRSQGSREADSMSMNSLQEQIHASLQKVQFTHERELASLHAENLKLRDRLKDLGAAAGKSLGAVLQVAASVPAPAPSTTTTQRLPAPSKSHEEQPQQPHVQSVQINSEIPSVVPKEGDHSRPRQGPVYRRLPMDALKEEARRSLATNT